MSLSNRPQDFLRIWRLRCAIFSHGRRNSVSFIRKEKPLRHIPRAAVLAGLRHPGRRSPAVERGAHHRPSGLRPSGAGRRLDVAGAYGKRHSGKMVLLPWIGNIAEKQMQRV